MSSTLQVEISFAYRRHTGPRFIAAGLTLAFQPAAGYAFRSEAAWPLDDYTGEVETIVKSVLEERGCAQRTSVVLKSIEWDDVGSSAETFRKAALLAARSAFEV